MNVVEDEKRVHVARAYIVVDDSYECYSDQIDVYKRQPLQSLRIDFSYSYVTIPHK